MVEETRTWRFKGGSAAKANVMCNNETLIIIIGDDDGVFSRPADGLTEISGPVVVCDQLRRVKSL